MINDRCCSFRSFSLQILQPSTVHQSRLLLIASLHQCFYALSQLVSKSLCDVMQGHNPNTSPPLSVRQQSVFRSDQLIDSFINEGCFAGVWDKDSKVGGAFRAALLNRPIVVVLGEKKKSLSPSLLVCLPLKKQRRGMRPPWQRSESLDSIRLVFN